MTFPSYVILWKEVTVMGVFPVSKKIEEMFKHIAWLELTGIQTLGSNPNTPRETDRERERELTGIQIMKDKKDI
jgi:hypothetical protein